MDDEGYFGGNVATNYDQVHGASDTDEVKSIVSLLGKLADGGPALEFAIGTGRVALPLQEQGIPVKGIELSAAMVAELRKKETGAPIEVVIGDMTKTRVSGKFSLVYLVYNTIDNLTSQDDQAACFENAAAHLKPGGRFLIETLVPPIQKIPFGETRLAFDCTPEHWGIDEFDIVTQQYTSHHIHLADGKHRRVSVPFRFAWPPEFDLMARLAGMRLQNRWGGWHGEDFTATSKMHVSVYEKL